jgi:DNA (cytosine-5)-methyltransferase 1
MTTGMIYGSVCSGIEAATAAWHVIPGWRPAWFAEIEPFPKAVLAHRWPGVPDLGDFTRIGAESGPIDLLVGGTPCQSFSIAGLRGGMCDARGNLALEFCRLAARLRPRWVVWENVPGVLSSAGGRDFGSLLGALAELGYGWAYRVLDAQYFGVAQRRRRVFIVGHLGDRARAAAVLLEPEGVRRDPPARRAAREEVAGNLGGGSSERGWCNDLDRAGAFIPFGTTQITSPFSRANPQPGSPCHTLNRGAHPPAIATMSGEDLASTIIRSMDRVVGSTQDETVLATSFEPFAFANTAGDTALGLSAPGVPPLTRRNGDPGNVVVGACVRRLTPRECERLQGFPDDYTLVPWRRGLAPDGPRYRALGNSMAVPVMHWIGRRIAMVEAGFLTSPPYYLAPLLRLAR